jgi:hypothetical protein
MNWRCGSGVFGGDGRQLKGAVEPNLYQFAGFLLESAIV